MKEKRKFFILVITLLILVLGLTFISGNLDLYSTDTRYMIREQDEVKAYYTALHFDNTGDDSVVALDGNTGYLSFQLMNYSDEDVTKRDIVYNIKTVSTFYDENGNEINPKNTAEKEKLYVKDVWGKSVEIGEDTYKYDVKIISNDGEKKDSDYMFKFEPLGNSGVGKIHNVTVQLDRIDSTAMSQNEKVSIVVQLSTPYKQVFIIDITVSNRLIVFSKSNVTLFDVPFERLHTQSVNIYQNTKTITQNGNGVPATSRPLKVDLYWKNIAFDDKAIYQLHNNYNNIIGYDPNKQIDGLDISLPYVTKYKNLNETQNLTIYVPQSSDFTIDYFVEDKEDYYLYAIVYIYQNGAYVPYAASTWGGYTTDDVAGKVTIIEVKPSS